MTERIINEYGFPFIDLQSRMNEIGLNTAHDFYNEHHLNIYGQRKVSDYLGRLTTETFSIVPMAQNENNTRRWKEAAACTYEYFTLAEQAIQVENEIWLDELANEWLFRQR